MTSIGTPALPCFNIYKHYKYKRQLKQVVTNLEQGEGRDVYNFTTDEEAFVKV